MRKIRNAVGWGSLAAGDAICFASALRPGASSSLVAVLAAHAAVAVVAAVLAPRLTPLLARKRPVALAALAALFAFFIPVFGLLALGALATFGPGGRPARREDPWLTVHVERDAEAFVGSAPLGSHRLFGASAIAAVLRDRSPENAGKRFQALLAVRRLPARAAVAVCKQALRDPSDEVRLFAFARIERFCDGLDESTKMLLAALDRCEASERGVLHLRLAETYWEWAYLRLAEGSVLDHAMQSALDHAEKAVAAKRGHGPAEFLRGRVLMGLGRHEEAHEAFAEALRSGLPRHKALPYMAECAFRLRRFDAVRLTLRELQSGPGHAVLRPVAGFWQ
jgi:tetratricopeptide (TPR) repeat protein